MDAETYAILTDLKSAVEWLRDSVEDIDGTENGVRKSTAHATLCLRSAAEALDRAQVDFTR